MGLDDIVPYGPVLHLTESEARNFRSFASSLLENPLYRNVGCVKVP